MRSKGFLETTISYRGAIWTLAIKSFQSRFVGTGGGLLWSLVQPLATVFVFWLVFSLGFKATGPGGTSFVSYFLTGFLPWTLFSESLTAAANSVVSNRHLVKRMAFPTETLPLTEVLSSSLGHAILLPIVIGIVWLQGLVPNWHVVQVLYGYGCVSVLALALGWLVAALNVIHRDVGQSLTVILNLGFWLTPVVWSTEMVPEKWRVILVLNPMSYAIEVYRSALLYQRPIWQDPVSTLVFWAGSLLLLAFGAFVFRRLKPQFPDLV